MLPDPEKVYDKDDVINALWLEFTLVLRRAKRVFVLGHSLNDAFLLRALTENVEPYVRIAVTGLPGGNGRLASAGEEVEAKVRASFGDGPKLVPLAFGVDEDPAVPAIDDWTAHLQERGLL